MARHVVLRDFVRVEITEVADSLSLTLTHPDGTESATTFTGSADAEAELVAPQVPVVGGSIAIVPGTPEPK